MLTPKVREDFFKYADSHTFLTVVDNDVLIVKNGEPKAVLATLPVSSQFGIYQDYFEQMHEIYADAMCESYGYEDGINKCVFASYVNTVYKKHETRLEAHLTAIKEACKLIEEKL